MFDCFGKTLKNVKTKIAKGVNFVIFCLFLKKLTFVFFCILENQRTASTSKSLDSQNGNHSWHVKIRKVMILGYPGVGKSSLCYKFVEGKFSSTYVPTVGSQFTRNLILDEKEYHLDVIDTWGQDESVLSFVNFT